MILTTLLTLATALTFAQPPFVYDGDTLYYHHLGLRLHGINAPEMDAPYGIEARDALRAYLEGKDLICQDQGEDKYRRRLTLCFADGKDISKWMVRNGWAIAYVYFSKDYIEDESYAREHQLGMWSKISGSPHSKLSRQP